MQERKKKGLVLFIYFLINLVDLLKSPVSIEFVDCMAYAPCKRLFIKYTTFAHKSTYCVRIVRLLRVKRLNAYVIVRFLRVATSSSVVDRLFRAI